MQMDENEYSSDEINKKHRTEKNLDSGNFLL